MSRPDDLRLADIVDLGNELASVVRPGREEFLGDQIRVRAAERLLEIIGEAANVLSEEATARFPEVPWRDITRLHILLAHHYHRVDPEQVWRIATVDVPELLAALERTQPI